MSNPFAYMGWSDTQWEEWFHRPLVPREWNMIKSLVVPKGESYPEGEVQIVRRIMMRSRRAYAGTSARLPLHILRYLQDAFPLREM